MTQEESDKAMQATVETLLASLDVRAGAEELPMLMGVYSACRGAARFLHGVPVDRGVEPASVFQAELRQKTSSAENQTFGY